jgi:hypothetical protein
MTRHRLSPAGVSGNRASQTPSRVGYALVGAGAATIVLSGVLGVFMVTDLETVDQHCKNKVCDAEGLAAGRRGAFLGTLAATTFAGGAVIAGAGGYLIWSSSDSKFEIGLRHGF